MVEATAQGDGVVRNIEYSVWRTDVERTEGYSRELINRADAGIKDWDAVFKSNPETKPGMNTLLKCFLSKAQEHPQKNFLGTRRKNDDGTFGDYQWLTYQEANKNVDNLARGMMKLKFCPEHDAEGRTWRFCGIWARNRQEWMLTLLAGMHYNITNVGFYDAMSIQAVDYILKQCELETIFCEGGLVKKIVEMKKKGLALSLKNLVLNDEIEASVSSSASEAGLTLYTFANVLKTGSETAEAEIPFRESKPEDVYIFSYTSGTTGDSKGVKLAHRNIMGAAMGLNEVVPMRNDDVAISYLPMPHSFEQAMTCNSIMHGLSIGFYQGNPLKLTDDCAALQPTIFPSVPRLYNKIYGSIKAKMDEATGCKRWLINSGFASKQAAAARAEYTSGCYDALIFKKVKALLGGRVRLMVTGSAPIDLVVLDYLKICFCVPILEGYGLTESSAGSCITKPEDPNAGHVGGPISKLRIRLKDVPEMSYLSTDKPYPRGEICMKGPTIFSGYFKREDKTAEAFDKEGWFMTGDVAQVYPNGTIKIIDRSKNIFKLSQGEYIAPEKLENIFVLSTFIEQSFVYGDSLKNCCVAIVCPKPAEVNKYQAAHPGVDVYNSKEFSKMVLDDMIRLANEHHCSSLEKPKVIHLISDPFSIENNLLTPTFKLKRNVAKETYQKQIDAMYEEVAKMEAAANSRQ